MGNCALTAIFNGKLNEQIEVRLLSPTDLEKQKMTIFVMAEFLFNKIPKKALRKCFPSSEFVKVKHKTYSQKRLFMLCIRSLTE